MNLLMYSQELSLNHAQRLNMRFTLKQSILKQIDMATKQIIPAVIRYTTVLGESINTVKTAGEGLIDVSVQLDLLKKASKLLKAANSAMSKLSKLVEKIPEYAEGQDRAVFCREKVVPAMEALREPVDELEMIVDKEMWPMPSYGDLVFEV